MHDIIILQRRQAQNISVLYSFHGYQYEREGAEYERSG